MTYDQARWTDDGTGEGDDAVYEPLLSEKDGSAADVDVDGLPDEVQRDALDLPALEEPEVARHYTRLSQMTYGVTSGPYPLGSCTMKYNPPFTEDVAALPDALVHPDRPADATQGCLALMHRLQDWLARIGGMDAVSLQPPAGAAGEYTGLLIAQAYHRDNGETHRSEVVIPDSAHGTNFASAAMAGYDVVEVPSGDDGRVDLDALEAAVGDDTAMFMVTNPNTLGLFEREIADIADAVHDAGGLLYYDGANLNALLGRARPGDMGFDVMHFNLHKTFATPHGGGGPGQGPVGVKQELARYLPAPVVAEDEDGGEAGDGDNGTRYVFEEPAESIGKLHGHHGNWLALVKAYAYVRRLGDAGLRDASAMAVLNANYLAERIPFEVPYGPPHHEFVASADRDAADVAKAMLDHGVHPPTTKWPDLVDEALMTEPTEVESKASLDRLARAFRAVADMDDDEMERAPTRTAARRIDQVRAAREPTLCWQDLGDAE